MGALLDALDASSLRSAAAAVIIDLERGISARWRDSADIYPASIAKLALMTDTFRRIAAGSLRPDTRIPIAVANVTQTAEPTPLGPGRDARVDELIALAIERSDNIAANQLIDLLGRDQVTRSMRALGLADFVLGRKFSGGDPLVEGHDVGARNAMTPAAAARLLELIARDTVPYAAEQRALLARCSDRDKLAAALDPGDIFMHKTGVTSAVCHDAGILQTVDGAGYVLVLYTTLNGLATGVADPAMQTWMRTLRARL
jgi:beta-lactamase class A